MAHKKKVVMKIILKRSYCNRPKGTMLNLQPHVAEMLINRNTARMYDPSRDGEVKNVVASKVSNKMYKKGGSVEKLFEPNTG
jgi:hypothetical protein